MSKSFSQGLRPVGSQWFSDWSEVLGIRLRPGAGGVSAITSTGKSMQVAQQKAGERLNWQQRREGLLSRSVNNNQWTGAKTGLKSKKVSRRRIS